MLTSSILANVSALGPRNGVKVVETPILTKNDGIYPAEQVAGPEKVTDLGTGGSCSV